MAEWLIEQGIGEHRAIRLDGGRITAARIALPGTLGAGDVQEAQLISRAAGSKRGTARFDNGEEALVDRLPVDASEGAAVRLEVLRGAIPERGRIKLAQARPTDRPLRDPLTLDQALRDEGHTVRVVRSFPDCDWDELWDEASSGAVAFSGGAIDIALTRALTVIDIDGSLRGRDLALAAVQAIADSLARFDLAGSIGIDFPTLEARADRQAVDRALAEALAHWPHERTAMNGFGFVQLVSRLTRPSLLHCLQFQRPAACARRLLRLAERVTDPGVLLLACHPAVKTAMREDWQGELARRTGRALRIEGDTTLAISGGFAQTVAA